jgi:hypothetical protein
VDISRQVVDADAVGGADGFRVPGDGVLDGAAARGQRAHVAVTALTLPRHRLPRVRTFNAASLSFKHGTVVISRNHHHHQPINVSTAGAQAFPIDYT